ncbi:Uma2 family endonuclease [Phormidesmis priestleyi]
MAITLIPSSSKQTQHIVFEGVSWATYQALLHDLGDRRSSRLAYDRGTLEIIMPSDLHEFINRFLEALVRVLAEESNLRLRGYGSTTLDREDLEQGAEPDACFYIQNVGRILGKKLDITTDPPPDLAVEVDITSSSRRRFGIYLQLQILEVWRYTKSRGVVIYQLQNGEYVECEFSPTFPMISGAVLGQFLQLADTEDDISVVRSLRQWLRTQNAPPSA